MVYKKTKLITTNKTRTHGHIVLSLSAVAVCAKIFGFTEKLVIAHFFGTSQTADVYFASTAMILSIMFFVKELIYPCFLPVFVDTLSDSTRVRAALFSKFFFLTLAILSIVAFVQFFFPNIVTNIIVPGFSQTKKAMTSSMLKLFTPAVVLLSLSTLTYTTLNAHRKFIHAAWPEAAFKLFIILGLISLVPFIGIYAIAVVISLAALGLCIAQLLAIPEHKYLLKFNPLKNNANFTKVIHLMAPMVIGVAFSHISSFIDNILASTLPTGQLAYLGYSKKLIDAILLVGPIALTTVVYSRLAKMTSAEDLNLFRNLFIKAIKILIYVCVPAAMILISLKTPIIKLLFQRGSFDHQSTLFTSQAFFVYSIGLLTFALDNLIVYSFYALSDTKTPVKVGIICVCLNIFLSLILLRPLQFLAIAWALVITKTIKISILLIAMNKKLKNLFSYSFYSFLAKVLLSSLLSWIVLFISMPETRVNSTFSTMILELLLPSLVFLTCFITSSYFLKISELNEIAQLLIFKKDKSKQ